MSDIYRMHETSFSAVSSYAILKDGKPVAKIALKFPKDGAGRLFAYVHWLGTTMVRGYAAGGGYDKKSAACASAVDRLRDRDVSQWDAVDIALFDSFRSELAKNDGFRWDQNLQNAGFTVFQTI